MWLYKKTGTDACFTLGLNPVGQSIFLFYNERFSVPIVNHFEQQNIVTFEDMFSVTFACLGAKKVKNWKIKKKIGPQLGNIYRECVCIK